MHASRCLKVEKGLSSTATSVISADDILPIVAYCIWKSRNASIAIMVHFVRSTALLPDRLDADLDYCLTTISAAVEFIKKPLLATRPKSTAEIKDAYDFEAHKVTSAAAPHAKPSAALAKLASLPDGSSSSNSKF